jgi:hypothetical protein
MIFCLNGSSLDKVLMDRPHFGTQEIVGDLLSNRGADEVVKEISAKIS